MVEVKSLPWANTSLNLPHLSFRKVAIKHLYIELYNKKDLPNHIL
jgi:hypothetical protein